MTRPALPIKLVRAPTPPRTCGFCGGRLTAIEMWHNCPQRRLALGLHKLRIARLANPPKHEEPV